MKWNNAFEAYWWVYEHPKLQYKDCGSPWIEMAPHMVCDDGYIHEDRSKNTHLEWWIECGPYVDVEEPWGETFGCMPSHDYELDCGGATAEDAVMKLAQLVLEKYGDY